MGTVNAVNPLEVEFVVNESEKEEFFFFWIFFHYINWLMQYRKFNFKNVYDIVMIK